MIYKCKKRHPQLTVGKQYKEVMPNANAYNSCVKADNGEYEYVPRKEFFDIVSK